MPALETIKIQNWKNKSTFVVINLEDFDESKHTIWNNTLVNKLAAREKFRMEAELRIEAEMDAKIAAEEKKLAAELKIEDEEEAKIKADKKTARINEKAAKIKTKTNLRT